MDMRPHAHRKPFAVQALAAAVLACAAVAMAFPAASSAQSAVCPVLTRDLYQGISGADVRSLQLFLVSQGLLSADSATAYFGPLTEAAVKAFQGRHLVEQTGFAGPFTRAAIALACSSGAAANQGSSQVSSQTAQTPTCSLVVSNVAPKAGESFTIQWNSQNAEYMTGLSGGGQFPANGSQTLTEAVPGIKSYALSFTGAGGSALCQANVTVTAAGTADFTASPFSGAAPLSVNFTLVSPQSGTSYSLDFGESGSSGTVAFGGSASHTYSTVGTYTARLLAGNSVIATKTITVTAAEAAAAPTCTLQASKNTIASGESVTLTWSSSNTTSGTITGGIGSVSSSGSRSIAPTQTTTYIAVFGGPGGSATCDATVTIQAAAAAPSGSGGFLCGSRVVTGKTPSGQSMLYGDEQISLLPWPMPGTTLKRTDTGSGKTFYIYTNPVLGTANIPCEGKELTVNPNVGVKNAEGSINCPAGYGGFVLAPFVMAVDPVSGYQTNNEGLFYSTLTGINSSAGHLISCVKGLFPPKEPCPLSLTATTRCQ